MASNISWVCSESPGLLTMEMGLEMEMRLKMEMGLKMEVETLVVDISYNRESYMFQ